VERKQTLKPYETLFSTAQLAARKIRRQIVAAFWVAVSMSKEQCLKSEKEELCLFLRKGKKTFKHMGTQLPTNYKSPGCQTRALAYPQLM
jgi:hypothetical protein